MAACGFGLKLVVVHCGCFCNGFAQFYSGEALFLALWGLAVVAVAAAGTVGMGEPGQAWAQPAKQPVKGMQQTTEGAPGQ